MARFGLGSVIAGRWRLGLVDCVRKVLFQCLTAPAPFRLTKQFFSNDTIGQKIIANRFLSNLQGFDKSICRRGGWVKWGKGRGLSIVYSGHRIRYKNDLAGQVWYGKEQALSRLSEMVRFMLGRLEASHRRPKVVAICCARGRTAMVMVGFSLGRDRSGKGW